MAYVTLFPNSPLTVRNYCVSQSPGGLVISDSHFAMNHPLPCAAVHLAFSFLPFMKFYDISKCPLHSYTYKVAFQ